MTYEYSCLRCEARIARIRPMGERNNPITCPGCGGAAKRVMSRFLFTANLSKDDPSNSLARIITKSSSSEDQLNYLRSQEKRTEAQAREIEAHSQEVDPGFGGIDIQGAWTAAHAGKEQLARWRKENIAPDPLALGSAE